MAFVQRAFDLVPVSRRVPIAHFGAGGQLDVELVEAEVLVDRRQQRDELRAFALDLVFACRRYARRPA